VREARGLPLIAQQRGQLGDERNVADRRSGLRLNTSRRDAVMRA
jgi:hypothetical protein